MAKMVVKQRVQRSEMLGHGSPQATSLRQKQTNETLID